MKNEKFEKRILIEAYKKIDFTPEGGSRFQACKVTYSYMSESEDLVGRQFVQINLPIEYFDKLKGCKLPIESIVVFSIEDLTKKPIIEDLKINNLVINK